ncbi:MAG: macro domain-containing protein [Archangium sp.]|nr:macro domain-containing protein [Archangium sp.]
MGALHLHLRDLARPMVDAWERAFDGVENVEIGCGDIFSTRQGPIANDAPIDVRADAIISPANSFGFMDGGIDLVYTYTFGPELQNDLQRVLRRDWGGELPVGCAVIVPTGRSEIPWCISAPTMRVPHFVGDTVNAYLAFSAALRAVKQHNAPNSKFKPISRLLTPGLGTAVGRMPVERCARQMRAAWDRFVGAPLHPTHLAEAEADHESLLE